MRIYGKQWYEITLYQPIGWLRRRRFYVRATTHDVAARKLRKLYPNAHILAIAGLGA